MSAQFYILWNQKREKELFEYVQETCKVSVIPVKKTDNFYTTRDITCFFVRKEDIRLFHYKKFREDDGNITEVIYPFDRGMNSLPFIEYSQEPRGDKYIGRIYVPIYSKSKKVSREIAQIFAVIKKWASTNSTAREKVGSIQIYSV